MRYEELERMYRLEDDYWWFVGRRRLVHSLVQRYGPPDPMILDAGCGTGGTMDYLRPLGSVYGADLSLDALQFCRSRGHQALLQCRAESIAARGDSFDVVVASDLLEHLPDDAAGVQEAFRVTKPGGIVVITVPAYQWLWSEHDEALSHLRRYSKRELRGLLEQAGADVVKLTYAVCLVFPAIVGVRVLQRRKHKSSAPHTQLMPVPDWANRLLVSIHDLEAWWLTRAGFPWGATLVAVARKPV